MENGNTQEIPYGTLSEQLEALNKAIYVILAGGQSYKIGSRSVTRADLSILIAERNKISTQIHGNTSGLLDGAYVADFGYDNRR